MGKFTKWIAGGLGWVMFGPVGGILGVVLGSLLEAGSNQDRKYSNNTTTGGFAMSLLVLLAAVMKADGKVMKSELNYVKIYFIRVFGEDSAQEALVIFRDILKQNIPVKDVSIQIGKNLDSPSKLQMLHLLFGVALADGYIHNQEVSVIEMISNYMGISSKDFLSIKAMFVKDEDAAYKILEITKDATNEEVKKAYRKMANKYHPDKVEYLGEDFKKSADEKFRKVNEAYETIKKARGIS